MPVERVLAFVLGHRDRARHTVQPLVVPVGALGVPGVLAQLIR